MKDFKAYIIKFVAGVISVVYLISPLHSDVKSMLHSISHNLEMPTKILSHNYEVNLRNSVKTTNISSHDHKIIDFINKILDNSTHEKSSNESNMVDVKIDKHYLFFEFNLPKLVLIKTSLAIFIYTENLKKGFYIKIKIPPQLENIQLA